MRSFQPSGGGLEQPMFPIQPPTINAASAAKRKIPEDGDAFGKTSKKLKNDIASVDLKRKQPGQEKIGGLLITRGPPVRSQSSQETERPQSRIASSETEQSANAGSSTLKPPSRASSKPPSSKTTTAGPAFARVRKKGKERDVSADRIGGEREVEEDVRQMNTEADGLRDRSRASMANMSSAALNVDFAFPPDRPPNPGATKTRVRQLQEQAGVAPASNGDGFGTPSRASRDTMLPITERETPQIMKNKLFRGEPPQKAPSSSSTTDLGRRPGGGGANGESLGHSRRRSSMGMRGKRISSTYESTGIITRPHTSVSDSSLFKHIDPDLPESQRVRQLLIWVSSRAMDPSSSSSSRNHGRKSVASQLPPDSSLPPLPPGGAELLKEIQDDLLRQLAEKKIDTSAYSGPAAEANESWKLKENEQNVRNKARERLFSEQIEERRKEDIAWAEVAQFYNAHQTNVLSSLNQRTRSRTPTSKAKGKQRATSQEPEELEPWENELPDAFRGSKGYDVAKQLLEVGVAGVGKGDLRQEELQYKEDRLHAAVSVSRQLTQITASELDHRFSLLSISLAQRTLPPANPSSLTNPGALSNFVPVTALPSAQHIGPDPQDLLRAISRTDAARPRSQLGDAARRAAKDVQRANETQAQAAEGGLTVERKLTDVPPPTPRKPPGTPKRASTPGTRR